MLFCSVLVLLLLSRAAHGAPVGLGDAAGGLPDDLLRSLGYEVPEDPSALLDPGVVPELQEELGMQGTGVLDSATISALGQPRCGNSPAPLWGGGRRRLARWTVTGSRWRKARVTAGIVQHHPTLPEWRANTALDQALDRVRRASGLSVVLAPPGESVPDLAISFHAADHGCGAPFRNSTLAHAFPPWFGGDMHINQLVDWDKFSLPVVLAHEMLHALGVAHTPDSTALMYPLYHADVGPDLLAPDDVAGMQRLYGRPEAAGGVM